MITEIVQTFIDGDGDLVGFDHRGDLCRLQSDRCIVRLGGIDDIRLFRDFIDAEIARREAADKGEQG